MMDEVPSVVVGAGVVGLALARALAAAGHAPLVLEAAARPGTGISARNSEVIHAGLYYPPGSLKAKLCLEGRERLYAFCVAHGVTHRRCGKLVVACEPAQTHALAALAERAAANGVTDLQWLDSAQARGLEPALAAHAALHSPATGIVDVQALMLALQGQAEAGGAQVVCRAPLTRAELAGERWRLWVGDTAAPQLSCRWLINCAGLDAPGVAARMLGYPSARLPQPHYAKGSYFALSGRAPFSRLIYPLPEPGGLGIHLTLDLGGQARFGPDVEWLEPPMPAAGLAVASSGLDYRVDPRRAQRFYPAIRRYWPALPEGALQPAYAGVRPKLAGPHGSETDFCIETPADHGVPGLVQLFGIESPGLTAALAIARHVVESITARA